MKEIKSCSYFCGNNKTEWKISYQDDKAVITKNCDKELVDLCIDKKTVVKETLSNLDIFFDTYDMERWSKLPLDESDNRDKSYDKIVVECNGQQFSLLENQQLPEKEKNIFSDLIRYFENYFEERVEPIVLTYHSFDGGGPQYKMEMEKRGIITWYSRRRYLNANHENLCGAGYDQVFTLYPLRKGNASVLLTGDSPICPSETQRIIVEVDENLNMKHKIEELNDF